MSARPVAVLAATVLTCAAAHAQTVDDAHALVARYARAMLARDVPTIVDAMHPYEIAAMGGRAATADLVRGLYRDMDDLHQVPLRESINEIRSFDMPRHAVFLVRTTRYRESFPVPLAEPYVYVVTYERETRQAWIFDLACIDSDKLRRAVPDVDAAGEIEALRDAPFGPPRATSAAHVVIYGYHVPRATGIAASATLLRDIARRNPTVASVLLAFHPVRGNPSLGPTYGVAYSIGRHTAASLQMELARPDVTPERLRSAMGPMRPGASSITTRWTSRQLAPDQLAITFTSEWTDENAVALGRVDAPIELVIDAAAPAQVVRWRALGP